MSKLKTQKKKKNFIHNLITIPKTSPYGVLKL